MQDFRRLEVWRRAHALALAVYNLTSGFPAAERFGLTNQMRRAAVSIAANIAEGSGREGDADTKRFLQIAMGSAAELHAQLLLRRDLGLADAAITGEVEGAIEEVKRMLAGLIGRIRGRL